MWFLIVTLFPNIGPLGVLAGHSFSIVLYSFLFLKFKVKFPDYFKYLILGSLLFSSTIVLSQLANYDQLGFSLGQLKYSIIPFRSEEHTSELQSRFDLVCRLLLIKII